MKPRIGVTKRRARVRACQFLDRGRHRGQLLVAAPVCGQRRGTSFEADAEVENVTDFIDALPHPPQPVPIRAVERGDERAARRTAADVDVSRRLQQAKRFADADAADAHLLGEFAFGGKSVAGAEVPTVNQPAQPLGNVGAHRGCG